MKECLLFKNDVVQALLVVRSEVAIRDLIAKQPWMIGDTGAFDTSESES